MSHLRKPIPHVVMEPNSAKCGATCLKMLYEYYGIQEDISDIWEAVRWYDKTLNRYNCNTYMMSIHSYKRHNLFSAFVSVLDPISLIRICLKRDIDVIPLYRPDLNSGYAHFSVVVDIDEHFIYLNDPEQPASTGAGYPIQIDVFKNMMLPAFNGEIRIPNTLLLVSKPNRYIVPCLGWNTDNPDVRYELDMPSFLIGNPLFFIHPSYEVLLNSLSRK